MGKLSDVIRHAGELSEETDDEDLWEDIEPENGAEEAGKEETQPVSDSRVRGAGESAAGKGTASAKAMENGVVPSKTEDTGRTGREDPGSGISPTGEEEASGQGGFLTEENDVSGQDGSQPGEEKASGQDGSQQGEDEVSGQEDPRPEEDTEPECNEEGIPLKDIIYAENVRRQRKDQVVAQSVYNRKIILDMLLRHAYLSTGGYCGLLISLCAIGAAIYTYGKIQVWISFVLLIAGSMFLIFEPLVLRDRAKQMTRKGGIYYMPILFILTPYGIELTRNGNHASHDWGDITRVTTTKHAVVLYKGRHTALVITKQGIGDQKEQLYAMIRQRARNAKYVKLK